MIYKVKVDFRVIGVHGAIAQGNLKTAEKAITVAEELANKPENKTKGLHAVRVTTITEKLTP